MKFTLEIEFGNDAMQTPADLADALGKLAGHIGDDRFSHDPILPDDGTVRDVNGNTVGRWTVA